MGSGDVRMTDHRLGGVYAMEALELRGAALDHNRHKSRTANSKGRAETKINAQDAQENNIHKFGLMYRRKLLSLMLDKKVHNKISLLRPKPYFR